MLLSASYFPCISCYIFVCYLPLEGHKLHEDRDLVLFNALKIITALSNKTYAYPPLTSMYSKEPRPIRMFILNIIMEAERL